MCKNKLGYISAKYESGSLGCGAISNGSGDPGGVSYGTYQLASNPGTLQKFLKASKYYLKFAGMKPGLSAFNAQWLALSQYESFCDAQHQFIKDTHYTPLSKYWDTLDLEHSCAIDEMLWSISVQHSFAGCKYIIDKAEDLIPANYDDKTAINAVYKCRKLYVDGLNMPDKTKLSLYRRYAAELADILNIQD